MSRWWLAFVTLVAAALLVGCDGDAEGDDDADLEAAIAFLDAAIRVDIRASPGDVIYWRNENEGRAFQTPPVRESWSRIGPNLMAVETLSRELGADGSLRSERHSTEGSQLIWRKDSAYAARTGLVEGTQRLVELTDETVTVEFRFADGVWSAQAQALDLDDAVEEAVRLTLDASGVEVERHIFVLTERGEEITLYRSRASREIVDDMPTPTPR